MLQLHLVLLGNLSLQISLELLLDKLACFVAEFVELKDLQKLFQGQNLYFLLFGLTFLCFESLQETLNELSLGWQAKRDKLLRHF